MSLFSKYKKIYLLLCFCAGFIQNGSAQSIEQWVQKGLALDSTGEYDLAIDYFNKAIDANPGIAAVWYNRGVTYMKMSKFNLAAVDFNKTLFLDSNFTNAYYNRSQAYRFTNNFQFALADLNEYIARNPQESDLILERVELALEMNDYAMAVQDLKALLLKNNPQIDLKYTLFQVLLQWQKYDEAIVILDELMDQNPEDDLLKLNKAIAQYYSGRYEASLNSVNLFLLSDPNNREALKIKADDNFYLNRFTTAASIYENLIRLDSMDANLLADYGHCLLQMKEYERAEAILTQSIRSKNDAPAYAYLGRGIARLNLGNGDLACEDWWKSSRLGENRAQEYLNLYCSKELEKENR